MNEIIGKLSNYVDFESIDSRFNNEDPYINLEILQEKAIFTKGPKVRQNKISVKKVTLSLKCNKHLIYEIM